jgi:hypothetical protein
MKKALVLILVMACGGGGSNKEPTTTTTTAPVTETPATKPTAEPKTGPAEAPPPIVLGDVKIVMAMKSKTDKMDGVITLAADGTINAAMTGTKKGKKLPEKKTTGKLTAAGELSDDKGEVIAKIADDGKVQTRLVMETKENGKTVKSETKWEDIGTFEGAVFTSKKDGAKIEIDDKGNLSGWPTDMGTITITSGAEQKRAGVCMVLAMFTASKVTTDSSASSAPAVVPTKK